MKLFPLMASMFAMSFASDIVAAKYKQLMIDIKSQNFKQLDVLHHFCSGMKFVYTQDSMDGLLVVR